MALHVHGIEDELPPPARTGDIRGPLWANWYRFDRERQSRCVDVAQKKFGGNVSLRPYDSCNCSRVRRVESNAISVGVLPRSAVTRDRAIETVFISGTGYAFVKGLIGSPRLDSRLFIGSIPFHYDLPVGRRERISISEFF